MTESFFETIRYCFAIALFAALPGARWTDRRGRGVVLPVWLAGLAGGGVLAFVYARQEVRTLVEGIVMLAAVPFLAALFVPAKTAGGRAQVIACRGAALLIVAQRVGALVSFALYKSLDRVNVLNTEFLLFFGGIALGAAALVATGLALGRLAASASPKVRAAGAAAVVVLLLPEHVVWGYYALVLGGWAPLPAVLFAPVASLVNNIRGFGYAQMGLAALVGVWCFLTRQKPEGARMAPLGPAGRRMYLWGLRRQWRYGVVFLLTAGATAGVGFYYKLYASRPPQRTPAQPVEAKAGRIVIPLSELEPEKLHRYAFTDGEEHVLRFIAMKDESGKVRAAYDACVFCGNKGYMKEGKDLICLACGAAIYVPTVGREGGCNPIPLVHSIEAGALVVTVDALVKGSGAPYFSGEGHE